MTKGYIFDLDGTIYLGDQLIPGAKETIQELINQGNKVVFLTNKSIQSRKEYVNKLTTLGIEVTLQQVINSNLITGLILKNKLKKGDQVYVIGEQPLINELEEMNISITTNYMEAKFVVIGWDRNFNYTKLKHAYKAWLNGATFIATNPDRSCPTSEGNIPDCGGMIGAIEGVTGEKIKLIAGKPSQIAVKYIIENVLKIDKSLCYIIGDRLDTDILMGINYNIKTVLVLTGITTKEMLKKSSIKPTFVLDSIESIPTL